MYKKYKYRLAEIVVPNILWRMPPNKDNHYKLFLTEYKVKHTLFWSQDLSGKKVDENQISMP